MSHTLNYVQPNALLIASLVITNYTQGGETVLPTELPNVAAIDAVFFATVAPGQNSLGVPLFPILSGGAIKLYEFSGGVPVEIPTTTSLNATINAIVHPSIW